MKPILDKCHLYIISRWQYSIGKEIISDEEYNVLNEYMIENDLLPEYTDRTWSDDPCPVELLKLYGLDNSTYDNITFYAKGESIESITNEVKLKELLGEDYSVLYMATPKIDGFSVSLNVFKGTPVSMTSRARDNNESMNFDVLLKYLLSNTELTIPKTYTGTITGEAYLTNNAFKELKDLLFDRPKSQRSSVVTAIKSYPRLVSLQFFDMTLDEGQKDKVYKYEKIRSFGLKTPKHKVIPAPVVIDFLKDMKRDDYDYKTDGIVIERLGDTINKYAVRLFDYASKLYVSVVVGIEESFGATANGLKLIIAPVETDDGNIQRKVDIDNLARIKEYNITKNSFIVFEKVSDAVEKINELTKVMNKGDNI